MYEDCTPPPLTCRRSLSSINDDAFGHSGYDSLYGTPLAYTPVPREAELPDVNQGPWVALRCSQEPSSIPNTSPETSFESNSGSMQEQQLLTPGNEAESIRSFHTAAGEMTVVETPPLVSNHLKFAACHGIGDCSHREGHDQLQETPDQKYVYAARAISVQG